MGFTCIHTELDELFKVPSNPKHPRILPAIPFHPEKGKSFISQTLFLLGITFPSVPSVTEDPTLWNYSVYRNRTGLRFLLVPGVEPLTWKEIQVPSSDFT